MTGAHARQERVSFSEYRAEAAQAKSPQRRRKADPAVVVSIVALVVLAASMVHVAQRARLATLAYELHNAASRLEELKRIRTQLTVEVEEARSLHRIEASARQLGMIRPTSTTWLVLEPDDGEGDASVSADDRRGWEWGAALAAWYNRVRSSIRAALPLHLRESGQ